MKLNIINSLVSVEWLSQNIDAENLIVIDATMRKITWEKNEFENDNQQIKKARYLDIKNIFSDTNSKYPNTILTANEFEIEARKLGINKESAIVVYDTIGLYTSPRVWWMFKSMGHNNIAILNGGFPEWVRKGYPTEVVTSFTGELGNFSATYNPNYFSSKDDVKDAIANDQIQILDARSEDRFLGTKEEPRKGLRSGHIPSAKNLYYNSLQTDGKIKSLEELNLVFDKFNLEKKELIFSCGSGITACILALGAEISGYKNLSVYDGSWTEWGSINGLPIEKK